MVGEGGDAVLVRSEAMIVLGHEPWHRTPYHPDNETACGSRYPQLKSIMQRECWRLVSRWLVVDGVVGVPVDNDLPTPSVGRDKKVALKASRARVAGYPAVPPQVWSAAHL